VRDGSCAARPEAAALSALPLPAAAQRSADALTLVSQLPQRDEEPHAPRRPRRSLQTWAPRAFAASPAYRDACAAPLGRRAYRRVADAGRAFSAPAHAPGRRSDIAVPSMGESMSEGTIAVVLKQPGAFALHAWRARSTP